MGAKPRSPLVRDADGIARCRWCASAPDYVAYHDLEWGVPVIDDRRLFEKLCLEGFQAGLSWITILRKRESFRQAFAGFDPDELARFRAPKVEELLGNAAIIRHRGKIEAAINNARRALALRDEAGSLAAFLWRFEPTPRRRPTPIAQSPESVALSRELKRRGWAFVGPTTVYSLMQAMGMVNDHAIGCHAREGIEAARSQLVRPT